MKKLLTIAFLATAGLFGTAIGSLTPTSAELVASGGAVVVYFAGETAQFDSVLNLVSPTNVGPFFQNHTTPVGTALNLGTFATGQVLRFRLDVTTTGNSFFTGAASLNPDNVIHVAQAPWAADVTIPVNGILVGFEDALGGGDRDYDDNTFVFTNVTSTVVSPEPSSMVLAAAGLLALAWGGRRRLS